MHEFIILILILITTIYLLAPLNEHIVHSMYKIILIVISTIAIFSLKDQGILRELLYIIPGVYFGTKLFISSKALKNSILLISVVLTVTSALKLFIIANYLGVVLFILLLGFVLNLTAYDYH